MQKELVRITTAGSVDDGKSTLIGRLLFDCNQIYQDHIQDVQKAGKDQVEIDYSLFTDGLSSEREQGITIDVAYRYFSTTYRSFIVADVPGHEQYTRNMVTGASCADIAIILIDARHGMTVQSKRHLFISSLLGIKHTLVVVNKMDLVEYQQQIYEDIIDSVQQYVQKLQITDLQFIPLSALCGDFVVSRTDSMPWYEGKTLLSYLNSVQIGSDRNLIDFRFPVQLVIRPNQDERHYAGTIASGSITVGETVTILPSGQISTIKEIFVAGSSVQYAFAPQSITLTLQDKIDVSRSNMIVRSKNQPTISCGIDATICWLDQDALDISQRYIIKHTTNQSYCTINELVYAIDIDNTSKQEKSALEMNDIGRVSITTLSPLLFDSYQKNKQTGSFILIHEKTNRTVAAGIIRGASSSKPIKELTQPITIETQSLSQKEIQHIVELLEKNNIPFTH